MGSDMAKNGHITYRTVIETAKNGSVQDRDETSYSGECSIETDKTGLIVCAVFDESPGVSNTLRIQGVNRVHFLRKGPVSSEFIYDPDETTKARVDTPYGSMELDLVTQRAEVISDTSGTEIRLDYGFPEAPAQRFTIYMSISLS